jgi:hypothetical protein
MAKKESWTTILQGRVVNEINIAIEREKKKY